MASMKERIFAGFGAVLFLASACAVTVYAIVETNSSDNSTNTASQTGQTCQENSVTAASETIPETYKPEGAVKTLGSTDLTVGSGQVAKAGDCLQVKYYGTLATTGAVFDENFDKTTALQFQLGKNEVIQGWEQGVPGMKVGGTRRLVIPAALAYGSQSPGSTIPANSDLVFVIKLIQIVQN